MSLLWLAYGAGCGAAIWCLALALDLVFGLLERRYSEPEGEDEWYLSQL